MTAELKQVSVNHWLLNGVLSSEDIEIVLKSGLCSIKQAPGVKLVVDCSGVQSSDSTGVALLIEWARHAKFHGKSIKFTHLPSKMRDIADVSGLIPILFD